MKNKVGRVGLVLIIMMSCFAGIFSFFPKEATAYTPHDSISIIGNDNFTALATYEGWAGDGTDGNPYIIEGYEIGSSSNDFNIEIESTTVHFIVRDSLVKNGWFGIGFDKVTNGTINNCTFENTWYGIFLRESDGNKINRNKFLDNSLDAIFCLYSSYNYIEYNIINSVNGEGILLESSVANNITNNKMRDCSIYISGSSLTYWNTHNIDSSNTLNGKPVYYWKNKNVGMIPSGAGQVILANCTNVTIENQEISNCYTGLELGFSSNCFINGNIVSSNKGYGILLQLSKGNNLINNYVNSNQKEGVYLLNSDGNHVTNNNITKNGLSGIKLFYSNKNTIAYNNASSNTEHGIKIENSYKNIITSNIVSLNNDCGIQLYYINSSNINYNIVTSNKNNGINVFTSNNCTINENSMTDNFHGIYLDSSLEIEMKNNNASFNWYGISLELSDNNIISGSEIIECVKFGLYLDNSKDNTLISNTLERNDVGINLKKSNLNIIQKNNVSYNHNGVYTDRSNQNDISYNNVSMNEFYGMYLLTSSENNISYNSAFNNSFGIDLSSSSDNYIVSNIIINNDNGLSFTGSNDNIIHHNSILNNTYQLSRYESVNIWNDGSGKGNYWSDYIGYDEDGDGVGDTRLPHIGVDNYPLTDRRGSKNPNIWQVISIYLLVLTIVILFTWALLKEKPEEKDLNEVKEQSEGEPSDEVNKDKLPPEDKA